MVKDPAGMEVIFISFFQLPCLQWDWEESISSVPTERKTGSPSSEQNPVRLRREVPSFIS